MKVGGYFQKKKKTKINFLFVFIFLLNKCCVDQIATLKMPYPINADIKKQKKKKMLDSVRYLIFSLPSTL